MADSKITDLPALALASMASGDVTEVVDVSATLNKKATLSDLTSPMPWHEVSDTPSTNQNDYAPSGVGTATHLMLNVGASMKITGISAPAFPQVLTLVNTSTDYLLWLENQNTSSTAANRIILPKGFPAFLMPGDSITLRYDTTASRWRVEHWPSQGPAMGMSSFNDFLCYVPGASNYPIGEYHYSFGGTGSGGSTTAYLANSTEKPVGMVTLSCGTTTTGRAHISSLIASNVWGQGPCMIVTRVAAQVATDGTQTYTLRTGMTDAATTGAAQNGITWEYRWNGSAAEWAQTSFSGGTATRSTTGSPSPTTNYVWLGIFVNADGSRADMIYSDDSVSFTKASSISSGLPTAGTAYGIEPLGINKSAGTTARLVTIDLAAYRADGVRG